MSRPPSGCVRAQTLELGLPQSIACYTSISKPLSSLLIRNSIAQLRFLAQLVVPWTIHFSGCAICPVPSIARHGMRFHVKCVRCGHVAGIRFIESASTHPAEEESTEQDPPLSGYTIECPACSGRLQPPIPAPHMRAEVAAKLTEATPLCT
jgi:hypothetical protein